MNSRPHHRFDLAVLGLLFSMVWAFADEANIQRAFEQAQAEHEQTRKAQQLALKRLHIGRLQAVETTLSNSANYEEAKRCRDAWQKLKATLTTEGPLELRLAAKEARLTGGLRLQAGTIQAWKTDAQASWTLPDLPLGGYQVMIEHAAPSTQITMRLSEAQFHVKGTLQAGSSKTSLGYLKVTKASGTIRLIAETNASDLGIQRLILIAQAPNL